MTWEASMAQRAAERRQRRQAVEDAASFVAWEAERRLPPRGFRWEDKADPDGRMLCLRCGESIWWEHPVGHRDWHDDGEPERPDLLLAAG